MSEYLSLRLQELYWIFYIVLMEKVLHHPEGMKPSRTSQSNSTTPGNHHPDQCKISPINEYCVMCGSPFFVCHAIPCLPLRFAHFWPLLRPLGSEGILLRMQIIWQMDANGAIQKILSICVFALELLDV